MTHIFLAVPHYGQLVPEALPSLMLSSHRHRVTINTNGASLLAHNFNRLWCAALNQRKDKAITHFAMHHADISAKPGWLDVLLGEMERVGADAISVVVPIKDSRGLTSTGLQDPKTLHIRRLTMSEVMELPETFSAADVTPPAYAGGSLDLMINTGLWLCRFTEPWVEEFHFEIRDAIVKLDNGQFRANVLPEDWNASGWFARRGLKVHATRKVACTHHGTAQFTNGKIWGDWQFDHGDS